VCLRPALTANLFLPFHRKTRKISRVKAALPEVTALLQTRFNQCQNILGRSSGFNPGSGTRGLGRVLLGNLSTDGRGGLGLLFVYLFLKDSESESQS
jgi:hypothetical protein